MPDQTRAFGAQTSPRWPTGSIAADPASFVGWDVARWAIPSWEPIEQRADGLHLCLQRATRKRQTVECACGSGLVSRAARVRDDDGDVPEVHSVSHCGLDADLERDADDHEGDEAAVA